MRLEINVLFHVVLETTQLIVLFNFNLVKCSNFSFIHFHMSHFGFIHFIFECMYCSSIFITF